MTNNFCVYMHVLPTGKKYIGITQNTKARWANGYGYRSNRLFDTDIRQVGWDNIEHQIIADNISYAQAKEIEANLIAQYNTTDPNHGYNRDFSEYVKFINSPDQMEHRKATSIKSKKVEQMDMNGNIIAEFRSISDAARAVGGTFTAISTCLNGRAKTSCGFKWRFKQEY